MTSADSQSSAAVVKPAVDVRPGERVRGRNGIEVTVTRIRTPLLGRSDLLCFIEDTPERWLALAMLMDAEVTVVPQPA